MGAREKFHLLDRFSQGGYRLINDYLRDLEPGSDQLRTDVELLDQIIDESRLVSDLVAYRGVGPLELLEWRYQNARFGSIITPDAYLSVTMSEKVGRRFSVLQGPGILLQLAIPRGSKVFNMVPYSSDPLEEELLLPRGTAFRLLSELDRKPFVLAKIVNDD